MDANLGLKEILLFLSSTGGGGLAYWLMEKVPFLKALEPFYKRIASLVISAVIPVACWGIMLAMAYEPMPVTWQAAIERIFALAAGAIIVSQGAHGVFKLRNP